MKPYLNPYDAFSKSKSNTDPSGAINVYLRDLTFFAASTHYTSVTVSNI